MKGVTNYISRDSTNDFWVIYMLMILAKSDA